MQSALLGLKMVKKISHPRAVLGLGTGYGFFAQSQGLFLLFF
jgi:hypothetical protein